MERVDQPARQPEAAARVAVDLLELLSEKLDSITVVEIYKRDATRAGDGRAFDLLDEIERHERADIDQLLAITTDSHAARAVRYWLEESWRHGEIVDDDEGRCLPAAPARVDRFRTHD